MSIIRKSLLAASLAAILAACTTPQIDDTTNVSANFVGRFSDSCASPTSSFTFHHGGTGSIVSKGKSHPFTWTQQGRSAFAFVETSGGKPAQTYTLNRTSGGIYLAAITVNGQLQNLTNVPANQRTKLKCSS